MTCKPLHGFASMTATWCWNFPPIICIFYRTWRHRREAGPLFVVHSAAKDSLMLISLHLSPRAASCLPQLLMHVLLFLCHSPPSPFLLLLYFCLCFFCLPTFPFLVENHNLPPTWRDKIKGMGKQRKWPFPPSYIPFSLSALSRICLVCIRKLIFTCCLGEDKTMRLYNEESSWDRHRKERGRSLKEVQSVENLQACQFQLVHSALWTQQFYFPSRLREELMFTVLSNLSSNLSVHYFSRGLVGQINPQNFCCDFQAICSLPLTGVSPYTN